MKVELYRCSLRSEVLLCSKGCSTAVARAVSATLLAPSPVFPIPPIQYRSLANGYVGKLIRRGFASPYSLLHSTSTPFTHNSTTFLSFPLSIHFSTAPCSSSSPLNTDSASWFLLTCPRYPSPFSSSPSPSPLSFSSNSSTDLTPHPNRSSIASRPPCSVYAIASISILLPFPAMNSSSSRAFCFSCSPVRADSTITSSSLPPPPSPFTSLTS